MAIFAVVASAVMAACGKDEADGTVKGDPIVPPSATTERTWPANALMTEIDTFYSPYYNQVIPLDRSSSMLAIYYNSSAVINNLPSVFCPVMPLQQNIYGRPGEADHVQIHGLVVLFENIGRAEAINRLKSIDGIYAIQPVYGETVMVPSPMLDVTLNSPSDTLFLFDIADSLGLSRRPIAPGHRYVYNEDSTTIMCGFFCDHALVNSITAGNIIAEEGDSRVLVITPYFATYQHDSI